MDELQTRLHQLFRVDEASGKWYYKIGNRVRREAGYPDSEGYLVLTVDKVRKKFTHFVWYKYYGHWPSESIDHKDRNKLNNRIDNLREADRSTQQLNKDSTLKPTAGIYTCGTFSVKYRVRPMRDGIRHEVGIFDSLEEAVTAKQNFDKSR